MDQWLLMASCRPGFVPELSKELEVLALEPEASGEAWGLFKQRTGSLDWAFWDEASLPYSDLSGIFIRHWGVGRFFSFAEVSSKEALWERIMELKAQLCPDFRAFSGFEWGAADEDAAHLAAKSLPYARVSIERKLAQAKLWFKGPKAAQFPRLQVTVLGPQGLFVSCVRPDRAGPHELGIPRLRAAPGAPSRAGLKIEEAMVHFLSPEERERYVFEGMKVVDLGAAPGGWTHQMLRRGAYVYAVDHGPMHPSIASHPMLKHLRENAFHYRPSTKVDWCLSDIVEKPRMVSELVIKWALEARAKQFVFNLKLPMKARYETVISELGFISETLNSRRINHRLRAKQLYHDRKEITVYLQLI